MTPTVWAPTRLYLQHVANLRELERAIQQTARLAKNEIASRDPQQSLRSLLRLYAFLLGAWAEGRLRKLLHEQFGFSDAQRATVLAENTQLGQWQKAVEVAFRRHHNVPSAILDRRVLGVSHAARFQALNDVLAGELRIIIEIRNKLAHGQWVYPFTSDGTSVEPEKYRLINQENLLSLQLKFSLIGHVADAIHDLVVSPRTFQRDFDEHFKNLDQVRINIERKSYQKYEQKLVASRQNFRESRGEG